MYSVHAFCFFGRANLVKLGKDIQARDSKGILITPYHLTLKLINKRDLFLDQGLGFDFEFTPSFEHLNQNLSPEQIVTALQYYVNNYVKMHFTYHFSIMLRSKKDKIVPYVNILIYFLYALGGSYIIWYGVYT